MKRILLAAALAGGLFTLAACGGTSGSAAISAVTPPASPASSQTPASGPHNSADVSFATAMIPHHRDAVTMAQVALTKANSPEIKTLAGNIKAAQDPEIRQMSGWLAGWNAPVPGATQSMPHSGSLTSGMSSSMPGMDMGGSSSATSNPHGSTPGMVDQSQMAALGAASGATFDRMWTQAMIGHHQGAVDMARTELAQGQNADAKALAQSIITSQSAEIATMTGLLKTLPS